MAAVQVIVILDIIVMWAVRAVKVQLVAEEEAEARMFTSKRMELIQKDIVSSLMTILN
jgi:hypothetical protein